MQWILGYLLVGFMLHWIGIQYYREPGSESWVVELAAIVLWPFVGVLMFVVVIKRRIAP